MSKRQLHTLTPKSLLKLYTTVEEILLGEEEDSENVYIIELEENIKEVFEIKTGRMVSETVTL